ncbi:MAG: hypothetical protein IJK41_07465 [Muribaculaceae bacterium]|nr:hypothetical protein [Muribaculaceae bacterium]
MLKSFEEMELQERRAIDFALYLIANDYGHTIKIPARELERQLKDKGRNISFMTIGNYFKTLERMGYAKKKMHCRLWGATYKLNRYAFEKMINEKQG